MTADLGNERRSVSTLAQQQQALLATLIDWPPHQAIQNLSRIACGVGVPSERGLKVYQANGHMLAERALRAAYPVLAQMLGEQSFADLARAFWHEFPPVHGDITVWGAQVGDFIGKSEQLQSEVYLPDVAKAEWALHLCASAPNREIDWPSLSLLTTEDPQFLGLVLAPGLVTVTSAWPLASLILAHMEQAPSLEEAAQQLRDRVAQDVVIWRAGFQPRLRLAMVGERDLIEALQSGVGLQAALETATNLDFSQWLPVAVQTGLVLGAQQLKHPGGL